MRQMLCLILVADQDHIFLVLNRTALPQETLTWVPLEIHSKFPIYVQLITCCFVIK